MRRFTQWISPSASVCSCHTSCVLIQGLLPPKDATYTFYEDYAAFAVYGNYEAWTEVRRLAHRGILCAFVSPTVPALTVV